VHIIKKSPQVSTRYRVKTPLKQEKGGMYSQFLQIGEVLEYVCWKLRDVVHAQVTAESRKKTTP